jgi:magnesium chelatase family protein
MDEDLVDVKGQHHAKRAFVIAAAGCHNVLAIGPPGTGKTHLAKRLPAGLPPRTPSESLETTRIYSAMGELQPGQSLIAVRPLFTPHHSLSDAGLVGGGNPPQPGQVSMTHKGVLFRSNSATELNRTPRDVLRRPRNQLAGLVVDSDQAGRSIGSESPRRETSMFEPSLKVGGYFLGIAACFGSA